MRTVATMTSPRERQQGFTLAELVVVVALLLVVLVPIGMTLLSANSNSNDLRNRVEARAQARTAIDQFARDFLQAQTRQRGLPHVEAITNTRITFYSPDKTVNPSTGLYKLRRITYRIVGTTLTRQETISTNTAPPWTFPTTPGPELPVVDDLVISTSPTPDPKASSWWQGYTAAGATVSSSPTATPGPKDVRQILINVTVNGIPRPGARETFTQTVKMRTEPLPE